MRFSNVAVAAAAVGSVSAADPSICDKYTTALLKNNTGANQYALLTLLVNTAVIGNYTGPGTKNTKLPGSMVNVPGILASNATYMGMPVNLAQYFDGSLVSTNSNGMPASVSFLDGGGADPIIANPTTSGKEGSMQYTLLTHLYSFFGALLQCSQYGKDGFPAYAGSNSQFNVHRYMDLTATEFDYFVSQVGASALSFGASMDDVAAVAKALNSTFGMKYSAPAMVVPNSPAQLQAICVGNGCPVASNAVSASYPAETRAATASTSSGSASTTPASSMTSSESTAPAGSSSSPAASSSPTTGAAPLVTAMPALAAGIAGVVALAL